MLVYKLFWDEFSSWLLEIVKPAYGQPINGFIYSMVLSSFERLLELLHPFMPFITEELWQQLREREPGASLMVTLMKEPLEVNETFLQEFELAKGNYQQCSQHSFAEEYCFEGTTRIAGCG